MTGIDDRDHHKVAGVPTTGRPSIYECREPAFDLGAFLDDHLPALRNARVLDAGSATGPFVPATLERAREVVAFDIALGRVRDVDARARRVCGDVQSLPFGEGRFDTAMAMHMLYHVPDIPAAVRELRRVVRGGGVVYAFTNGERAQRELAEVIDRNGCDPSIGGDFDTLRFSNENGADFLSTTFADVTLVEFTDSELVVSDPEQIVDEVERNRYLYQPGLRRGVTWDALVEGVRRDSQRVVAKHGAFRMSENHGLFTCR